MSAVGFSDTKPLIDPKDPRSVTMNRRVDIVVLTTLRPTRRRCCRRRPATTASCTPAD